MYFFKHASAASFGEVDITWWPVAAKWHLETYSHIQQDRAASAVESLQIYSTLLHHRRTKRE